MDQHITVEESTSRQCIKGKHLLPWECKFFTLRSTPTFQVIQLVLSLTTKKQMAKFLSAYFQKMLSPSYIILRIQRLEGKQCISR